MITAARLVDGAREMQLIGRDDIAKTEFDIPLPATREDVEERTDDDGTDDRTAHHGSRAVAINFREVDSPDAVVAELGGFVHPAMRPYLVMSNDQWLQERRLRLRIAQGDAPQAGPLYPFARDVQAQWVAPSGVWETSAATTFVVNADEEASGRAYNLIEPRLYPSSMTTGVLLHTNPGSTFSHFVARLYGPCRGPRLTNESTGESVSFTTDLTLAAGEYLEIDSRLHSALLLSNEDASRLDYLDFFETQWWRLVPGLNQVRYHPREGVDAGCMASIDYFPAWLWL